jgi:ABC-2 type transport system ATP-binding protein
VSRPTAGEMSVLGGTPRQDPAFLAGVGYLAQEIPLYRRFTADEHISIGAHLNRRWDPALVRDRLKSLNIPLDRAAGSLSGSSEPSSRC